MGVVRGKGGCCMDGVDECVWGVRRRVVLGILGIGGLLYGGGEVLGVLMGDGVKVVMHG